LLFFIKIKGKKELFLCKKTDKKIFKNYQKYFKKTLDKGKEIW